MEDKYTKTHKCVCCSKESNPMPKNLGDVIWKCKICGNYMKHSFRDKKVYAIERPEKRTAMGNIIY